jgi:hypothetical protein
MPRPQKSPIRASRVVRRRHRSALIKTIVLLLGLGAFTYCFSWLSEYPAFSIASVSVAGIASSSDQALVQQIAEHDVAGSYLNLFSKANLFLYPRSKIIADILAANPQIAAVALAMGPGDNGVAGRTLSLSVTERQPAYEWCPGPASAISASSTMLDTSASISGVTITGTSTVTSFPSSPCYFMDTTGYVFEPFAPSVVAPSAGANVGAPPFFRFYGRLDASTTPIGLAYLAPADFQNLTRFIASLPTLASAPGMQNVSAYALVDRADGVDELFLTSGGVIVFDDTENLTTVSADIAALAANSPVFGYGQKLQYLDLRVGNKAFYKLVGNTATTTAGN